MTYWIADIVRVAQVRRNAQERYLSTHKLIYTTMQKITLINKKSHLPMDVTNELEDLFVTAISGGSNYWLDFHDPTGVFNEAYSKFRGSGAAYEEVIWRALMNGAVLPIHDCETGDLLGHLSAESIANGLDIMQRESPEHFDDFIYGVYDANTADVFLQYAVLGQITFG